MFTSRIVSSLRILTFRDFSMEVFSTIIHCRNSLYTNSDRLLCENCISYFLAFTALTIRKKAQQQVFAVDICQFEDISTKKI